jgi:hypothetical protein
MRRPRLALAVEHALLRCARAATLLLALAAAGSAQLACTSDGDGGAAGARSSATGGSGATTSSSGAAGAGGAVGTGGAAGHGGAAQGGAGGSAPALCEPVANDLLGSGDFEAGMAGLAPADWQVRNPVLPEGDCLASGTPGEHLFLESSPCGGSAVGLDARGQWDCYAIQRFSDYDTIEGGASYRISVVARSQGNAPNGNTCPECVGAWFHVGAQWLDANDAVFGDEKNPHPATPAENDYDWKVLTWDLPAPADARRIVVWLTAHFPGRVDYDRVTVTKLP